MNTSPALVPHPPAQSAHLQAQSSARVEGLKQLQQDITKNLAKFQEHTVEVQIPDTYWFSDEYPSISVSKKLDLADSYARLPTSKPLSGYRVAIITGEGGLFQGLPELAACCDLTLQVDCDPKPLQLSALMLEELRGIEKCTDEMEKLQIISNAVTKLKEANPQVNGKDTSDIVQEFQFYTMLMKRNLFSSPERFAEFKRCQDHPVQQVCLSYFSKATMTALSQILKKHDASVLFLNISNVCEYPMYFYQDNPYDGMTIADMTPSLYIRELPFSDDAICAYSRFFGSQPFEAFTATTTIAEIPEVLHRGAIGRRDYRLLALTKTKDPMLCDQLCGKLSPEYLTTQLSTRIFQFFAKHPTTEEEQDWILRVTAARPTNLEVQDLKAHKEDIKSLHLQNQTSDSQPSLLLSLLDKITAEPTPVAD